MILRTILAGIFLVGAVFVAPVAFAQDPDDASINRLCATVDDPDALQHSVALGIAERYELDYEQIMAWFCQVVEFEDDEDAEAEDSGFGQLMLALETAATTGDDPRTIWNGARPGKAGAISGSTWA